MRREGARKMIPTSWTSGSLTGSRSLVFEQFDGRLCIRANGNHAASSGYWQSAPVPVASPALEITTTAECETEETLTTAKALVQWNATDGAMLGVDYLLPYEYGESAHELRLIAEPPPDAATCTIILLATNVGSATLRWTTPRLTECQALPSRQVTVASARLPANRERTIEFNLSQIIPTLAATAEHHPDIVCLPEMCASWGVEGGPREVAIGRQRILARLAEGAIASGANVAAAFYEAAADGQVYNTALLVDRHGDLIGEYRKTHLTTLEILGGVQAGTTLDVFGMDVGQVAIVICWDMWYPEPLRLASLKHADIVLWPYEQDRHVGHRQVTARARAMDNGVVIVGSSQVGPAPIIDDDGNVLAELETEPVYATVEIGRLLSGPRWPQSPPAHQNRRNLTTGERNSSVSRAIAFANSK
jgi:predicted amidohydrolase